MGNKNSDFILCTGLIQRTIVRKIAVLLVGVYIMCMLSSCSMLSDERIKLRDLEFTILSEDTITEEMLQIVEERKAEPFKLTYSDNENLYIMIGYGEQETGGYSIAVEDLYLTDNAIYVSTSLIGPEPSDKSNPTKSYPYIVIKTELLDQTVMFE